ncbi:MAG TPA: SET domain-containing protein-lysine N-methyltransferase [Thermoanaerobaculia bacterium]|nr:SET domain-containing protein-lysine N-methyltransferase [Thermoanaerobaculia bacterium]
MDSVEVRASRIHGKGVFAYKAIKARRKIGELAGELISLREARRRAASLQSIAIVEFDDDTALDASVNSNELRYVNHSCAPNTYMRRYAHRVEFYSLRAIRQGEELTCDYGETHHDGTLPCGCGADRCRRFI